MKKINLIVISGALIFLLSATAIASLRVDPFKIEIKTDAGTSYENFWSLKNNYGKDIKVTVTASEWGSYKGNENLRVEDWLKISPSEILIPKGETAEVKYKVDVSPRMQGSLLAQVTFTVPPGSGGMVYVKMSAPLHVIVRKTEKVDFEIGNFDIALSSGGYEINFRVKNSGNIIIKPQGEISVYKKKMFLASVNMTDPVNIPSIFIGESGKYKVILPTDLKAGKYKAEAKIKAYGRENVKKVEFKVLKDGKMAMINGR